MNRLDRVALKMIEKLTPNIAEICGPDEPPALLHGDLWSGNRMVDKNGKNWLIDPSLHWGHREYDLAMMQLFGGFSAEVFSAYNEEYQLDSGWQHRVRWYQIPPLLVHAILFGGHYEDSALAALSAFA
ncbi:MAG: hypothetical protein CSA83_02505 [Actinomycetales bacterium]|nr:MAG: hypothetical protein CSA83_02505 [Actinomycetales bacterium]